MIEFRKYRKQHGVRRCLVERQLKQLATVYATVLALGIVLFVDHGMLLVCGFVFPSSSSCTFCQRKCHTSISKYGTSSLSSSSSSTTSSTNTNTNANDETLFFVDTSNEPKHSLVQRKYETYRWKYRSGFDNEDYLQKENDSQYHYDINYRVEGPADGIPILLVHGFGANVNHFRYQFPDLMNAGYRVYAIDLIGFGSSDKPTHKPGYATTVPFGYSIELFSALITDFVVDMTNARNTKAKWVIAGNSIGGLCCLCLAESKPQLIQAVTLFNCAGGMTGFRYSELPWYIQPLLYFLQVVVLGPYLGPKFFKNFKSRENIEQILKSQVYRNATNVDEELIDILLRPSDDVGAEKVFLQVFGGPPGPIPEDILPNILCPILAIWGGNDPWIPVDYGLHPGNTFGQYNTNFTLHVVPDTGHCPHDERPAEVNAIMIPWLQKVLKTT